MACSITLPTAGVQPAPAYCEEGNSSADDAIFALLWRESGAVKCGCGAGAAPRSGTQSGHVMP